MGRAARPHPDLLGSLAGGQHGSAHEAHLLLGRPLPNDVHLPQPLDLKGMCHDVPLAA